MKRFLFRLVFSTLFLYWLIPGLALAQDNKFSINTILNPAAVRNGTDLSIYYLGTIFGVVDGVLHGSGTQIMGQMFGILNTAALVLGGIIIIFTLMISILNTANEGEVLGRKWSSVWIPLRSVLGIALLLPKATGYSIIQIFMMWVIVQGVAVGDSIWNSVLDYISNGGVIITTQQVRSTDDQDAAIKIFKAQVCMYGVQAALQKQNENRLKSITATSIPIQPLSAAVPFLIDTVIPIPTDKTSANFPGKNNIMPKAYKELAGICGTITWTGAEAVENKITQKVLAVDETRKQWAERIQAYKIAGIQQMITDTTSPAQQYVNNRMNLEDKPILKDLQYFPDCNKVKKGDNTQPRPYLCKLFYNAAGDYERIMNRPMESLSKIGYEFIEQAKKNGWLLAGMYYMNLNNVNQVAMGVMNALKNPATSDNSLIEKAAQPGSLCNKTKFAIKLSGLDINTSEACKIVNAYRNATKFASTAKTAAFSSSIATNKSQGSDVVITTLGITAGLLLGSAAILILAAPPLAAIILALVGPYAALLIAFIQLVKGSNPIVMLGIIGNILVTGAMAIWAVGAFSAFALSAALGAIPFLGGLATSVNALILWVTPLLNVVILMQFITGMTLMFYLPLIPFLIFTFAAIGWIILVIEAMVAAPIIALGITHPEGHEVVGKADPAILLLVNVFLRPGLMIIGFVTGIMLSYVGIWIFNQGYFLAFINILPQTMPVGVLVAIPAFLIIYTFAVIAIMNQAFTLIHVLPDKVLRWIGGPAEMAGAEATKALGEVKSGFESGSKAMGEGIGSSAKAAGERADQERKEAELRAEKEGDGKDSNEMTGLSDTDVEPTAEVSSGGGGGGG